MVIHDLINETLLIEMAFRDIDKNISIHTDKLQRDAKEINLKIISKIYDKTTNIIKKIKHVLKQQNINIIDVETRYSKDIEILKKLKDRITFYLKKLVDVQLNKELIKEAIIQLQQLLKELDETTNNYEIMIKRKIGEIAKEVTKNVK